MSVVYKICGAADWEACQRDGRLPWSPADTADGYVHLSAPHQVQETAEKHYRDQGDLWLLGVETQRLPAEALRWEVSRGDDRFPHLHGDLPHDAVVSSERLALDDDGVPQIPPEHRGEPMAPAVDEVIIAGIADELPVGIWVARAPNGEFVYANEPFKRIMGMAARPDVAMGEYAAPYGIHGRDGSPYPEDRMPFVRALQARARVMVDDLVIHRPGGDHVFVRAYAQPVFRGSDISHVVIAFFDITREVQAEQGRIESERRMYAAQRLESIGTLAGGIAHDFNNLLGVVSALASLLLATESDPQRRGDLQTIGHTVTRASELTRALLGFAGRGMNLSAPFSINRVVASVLSILERTLPRNLVLTHDLAATQSVLGDHTRMEQVLMNLLLNARDAVEDAGRISIRTRDDGDTVIVEVEDDGPGVDIGIRERIFEPYFTTRTRGSRRGTGLGLATAYGIAEAHGGSIVVEEAPRGGALFRVSLPASSDQPPATSRTRTRALVSGQGHVLVVDDDAAVRVAARRALEVLGYSVTEAADGLSAVQIFSADRSRFDAVLLDVSMPGLDGRETYLALRDIDPSVRVVVTTGHALNELAQQILDLGVQGFIEKPFDIFELSVAIAEVLRGA